MYVGQLKENCVHLGKCASTGLYNNISIVRFFYSVYSLSGPFSVLQEP
jgi:hypothetical protein